MIDEQDVYHAFLPAMTALDLTRPLTQGFTLIVATGLKHDVAVAAASIQMLHNRRVVLHFRLQ